MSRGARIGTILSLMVIIGGLFMAAGWVGAQEDTIVLGHKDVFRDTQRPPVKFSHQRHADLYPNCVECHHEYVHKDGVKVNEWSGEGQSCSQCHKVRTDGKKVALREAFHQNCTGCHRGMTKAGKQSGPATCGECHLKAK